MPNPTEPAAILAQLNKERRAAKKALTLAALDLHRKIDAHLRDVRGMSRTIPIFIYDETDTGADIALAQFRFNHACDRALGLRHTMDKIKNAQRIAAYAAAKAAKEIAAR
jgi:hypothetical protein